MLKIIALNYSETCEVGEGSVPACGVLASCLCQGPCCGAGVGAGRAPVGTVLCHPDVLAELSGWL